MPWPFDNDEIDEDTCLHGIGFDEECEDCEDEEDEDDGI